MTVHQLSPIELACHREAYKRACITQVKDQVAQVRHTHQTTARTRRPEIASTSNHTSHFDDCISKSCMETILFNLSNTY